MRAIVYFVWFGWVALGWEFVGVAEGGFGPMGEQLLSRRWTGDTTHGPKRELGIKSRVRPTQHTNKPYVGVEGTQPTNTRGRARDTAGPFGTGRWEMVINRVSEQLHNCRV